VPEYDAFGREIGEDTLKHLREATNPVPAAETPRVEAEAPPVELPRRETPHVQVSIRAPENAAAEPDLQAWSGAHEPELAAERVVVSRPEFVRPRRRRRGFPVILVLGVIVAGIGLAANSVVDEGRDLIDRAIPELPDPEPDAAPPLGLEADSLIRADNFAAAMVALGDSGLGRPTHLRIAPERIDAQLLQGNTLHVVQITPDGELRDFGSSQGTGRPIPLKAIDPAAPERLVRRAATRKSPPRNINYLVISPGPPPTIGAYFKTGRIVIGDAHGRPQRVL
jgi:hypothetical protein